MIIKNAESWLPAILSFETMQGHKSISVYLNTSENALHSTKSWRVYAAFGRSFEEPSDEASKLIFDSISESDIVSRVFVTTKIHKMIPCQICEIEDIPDSQVFEICSTDNPAFKLMIQKPE